MNVVLIFWPPLSSLSCVGRKNSLEIYSRSLTSLSHGSLDALFLSCSLLSYQNIASCINQLSEPPSSSNPEEQQRPTKQTNNKKACRHNSEEAAAARRPNHTNNLIIVMSPALPLSLNTVPVRGGVEVVPLLLQLLLVGHAIDRRRRSAYIFCQIALYRFWRLFSIAGCLFFCSMNSLFLSHWWHIGIREHGKSTDFRNKKVHFGTHGHDKLLLWGAGNGSDKVRAHSGSRLTC